MKSYIKLYLVFLCFMITATFVCGCVFSITSVNGTSMQPTIFDGDTVFSCKMIGKVERFDIVIAQTEVCGKVIKRVIGLPGETVYISEGNVYINGEKLDDVVSFPTAYAGRASQPVTLGENEYFLLGDNRDNSFDSRDKHFGTISFEDFLSKVLWIP